MPDSPQGEPPTPSPAPAPGDLIETPLNELAAAAETVRMAGQVPRCLGCGYTLLGLPEPRCPECGRSFNPWDHSTYTVRPPFLAWRFWAPGLALAAAAGLLAFAAVVPFAGWGWTAVFVVPFAGGAVLGYGVRVKWIVLPLLGLVLLTGFFFGLITMQLTGVFCGMVLAGIVAGPILVGIASGWVLRQILKRSRFDQRWHLPNLVFLLLPLACAVVERAVWTPPQSETIRTSAVLDVSAERAWNGMRFYEQVDESSAGPRPRLFRWHWPGLPRPLSASGSVANVGDRTTCVYDKGRLVKQVTARDAGRRLAFRVVEQGFERHSMRLVDGSFTFDPIDASHARVTLETTYIPHLRPRWCWRAAEAWTVRTLHGYVLQGIAAQGRRADWAKDAQRGGAQVAERDDLPTSGPPVRAHQQPLQQSPAGQGPPIASVKQVVSARQVAPVGPREPGGFP